MKWGGEEDPMVLSCRQKTKLLRRIQRHSPSVHSVAATHKPDVLIKMPLKETNQLTDSLHDGLFYLTHRRLLMSITLLL